MNAKTSPKAESLLTVAGLTSLKNVSVPAALAGEIADARAFIAAASAFGSMRPRLAEKVAAKAAWLAEAESEMAANGWTVR